MYKETILLCTLNIIITVYIVRYMRRVNAKRARDDSSERSGPQAMHHVGGQVVQVASVQKHRAVHRVAQRRQEARCWRDITSIVQYIVLYFR